MPLYTYVCRNKYCGMRVTEFRRIENRDDAPRCDCSPWEKMKRVIEASNVAPDYQGYDCPITGKWIEGKRQHQENLKKHGCRLLEGGEKEELQRRREAEDRRLDREIGDTVGKIVSEMPVERLSRLQEGIGKVDFKVDRIDAGGLL